MSHLQRIITETPMLSLFNESDLPPIKDFIVMSHDGAAWLEEETQVNESR